MAKTAAEEKAQNFLMSCNVIRATIFMKIKSDCWLFGPLLGDAEVGILIDVEVDGMVVWSKHSGSTLVCKRGRLSSLTGSFWLLWRNMFLPKIVILVLLFAMDVWLNAGIVRHFPNILKLKSEKLKDKTNFTEVTSVNLNTKMNNRDATMYCCR